MCVFSPSALFSLSLARSLSLIFITLRSSRCLFIYTCASVRPHLSVIYRHRLPIFIALSCAVALHKVSKAVGNRERHEFKLFSGFVVITSSSHRRPSKWTLGCACAKSTRHSIFFADRNEWPMRHIGCIHNTPRISHKQCKAIDSVWPHTQVACVCINMTESLAAIKCAASLSRGQCEPFAADEIVIRRDADSWK